MQPVFSAAEMRALDARAIQQLGIPGIRLMEKAGAGAARIIAEEFGPLRGKRIVVVCGKGNNGGDGFVVARHLKAHGARVRVLLIGSRRDLRGDAAWARGRWKGKVDEILVEVNLPTLKGALAEAELIVDALLGTGLTGPARDLSARAIELMNQAGRPVISLDLPSGLSSDHGDLLGPTVRAALTPTFAGLKRSLLLFPGAGYAGRVRVVDIGIPAAEAERGAGAFLLEERDIRRHFPKRAADAHKGAYGHLLVVAGSAGKTGAAALAARSALRSGAGLVTVATAFSQQPVVAALGMEFMTEPCPETGAQSLSLKARERIFELAGRMDAVALGPGLGLDPETQDLARALIAEVPLPMVVDADALTALSGHLDLLGRVAAPRVLTPHPGEMARMLGVSASQIQSDRFESVRSFCTGHRVFLALKGAGTVIGRPDGQLFVNPTGNPGMAKGGSGDVLTGMIGAFLARGFEAEAAVQAGCYLHGLAGDLACAERGEEAMIAGDIIEAIPAALRPARPARRR
jgi:hydroxyethylthiazole kinase-like uncharacterized protein yjeF